MLDSLTARVGIVVASGSDDRLCDAEVCNHRGRDSPVGGMAREQHVVRLDVPVDDAVLVRICERACDLAATRARSDSPTTNGIVK